MTNSSAVKIVKRLFTPSEWIQFPRYLLNHMSANEALLLAELINQWKVIDVDDDDWFPYSVKDVQRRLSMSKDAQRRAIIKLVDCGVLQTKAQGFPRCREFKIGWDVLVSMADEADYNSAKSQHCPIARNRNVSDCDSAQINSAKSQRYTTYKESEERKELSPASGDSSLSGNKPGKPRVDTTTKNRMNGFTINQSTKSPDRDYADHAALKLANGLKRKRKIMRRPDINKWGRTIRKFINESIITEEELQAALEWYIEHIGEPFVPECYSAQSFVDKFPNVVAATLRNGITSSKSNRMGVIDDQYMSNLEKLFREKNNGKRD